MMGLFEPIFNSHPEGLEGRPNLNVKAEPSARGEEMEVVITMLGYLDDSVSGERFVGLAAPGGKGWVLMSLWRRNLYSRGKRAASGQSRDALDG